MNEKRTCALCGNEITKGKGMNQKAYLYALQHGAHLSCLRIHEGIMRKHRISPNDHLNAVIKGMFLLFPELEETKTMREYQGRMRKAEEEIKVAFPYLKKKGEKKQVEEKKQEVEKGEKANDKI